MDKKKIKISNGSIDFAGRKLCYSYLIAELITENSECQIFCEIRNFMEVYLYFLDVKVVM